MEDKDANIGPEGLRSTEGEKPSFLQLARNFRDRLDDVIEGRQEAPAWLVSVIEDETPRLRCSFNECTTPSTSSGYSDTDVKKRRMQLALAGVQDELVCAQHRVATLDPAVWRHLPAELLESIFARLPVPAICRIRTLSQQWQRSLYFGRKCMEVNTKMFALIEDLMDHHGQFLVQLYDVHTDKCHVYPIHVGVVGDPYFMYDPYTTMMSASDGGLVVFVLASEMTKGIKILQIVIVNPLTHTKRVLPIKGVTTRQLQMVQIITDCKTGHYKVIVVGHHTKGHEVAHVYFSNRDEWVSMKQSGRILPERFFGIKQYWNFESYYVPERFPSGPCVYNYDKQKLTELIGNSLPEERTFSLDFCALVDDRLFVLHDDRVPWERALRVSDSSSSDDDSDQEPQVRDRYCITECQGQIENPNWTQLRSIRGVPFVVNPLRAHYKMRLHACRGFLLVVAGNHGHYENSENFEVAWLYDLVCKQWRQLPEMPQGHWLSTFDHLMVELRWDTDPNIEADPVRVISHQSFISSQPNIFASFHLVCSHSSLFGETIKTHLNFTNLALYFPTERPNNSAFINHR